MEISKWQLMFLSRIHPGITLEEAFLHPDVQKEIPLKPGKEINDAVEELLKKALDRLAVVFLKV